MQQRCPIVAVYFVTLSLGQGFGGNYVVITLDGRRLRLVL